MGKVSSPQLDQAIIDFTAEIGTPEWLWGIKADFDDGGTFIEVTVNKNAYPKEDPLPRRYKGIPMIVMTRETKPVGEKN